MASVAASLPTAHAALASFRISLEGIATGTWSNLGNHTQHQLHAPPMASTIWPQHVKDTAAPSALLHPSLFPLQPCKFSAISFQPPGFALAIAYAWNATPLECHRAQQNVTVTSSLSYIMSLLHHSLSHYPLRVSTEHTSLSEIMLAIICWLGSFQSLLLEQKLHEGKGFPCLVHKHASRFPMPGTVSGRISNAFGSQASGSDEWWELEVRQEGGAWTSRIQILITVFNIWIMLQIKQNIGGWKPSLRPTPRWPGSSSNAVPRVVPAKPDGVWQDQSRHSFPLGFSTLLVFLVLGLFCFQWLCLNIVKCHIQPKTQLGLFSNLPPNHNYLLSENATGIINQILIREWKN